MKWLIRLSAACLTASVAVETFVAPGIRGNATGDVVDAIDTIGAFFSYATTVLLFALIARLAMKLLRAPELSLTIRLLLLLASADALAILCISVYAAVPPPLLYISALLVTFFLSTASIRAIAPRSTRILAIIAIAIAYAAVGRLVSWNVGTVAAAESDMARFGSARIVATLGLGFEAIAQLLALGWLAARGRALGLAAAVTAVIFASVVTWGAANGVLPDAPVWQAVLHSSLVDASIIQPLSGLAGIAVFLIPVGFFIALAAIIQRDPVALVTGALPVILLTRGAFDVPIYAAAAVAGAQWILLHSGRRHS